MAKHVSAADIGLDLSQGDDQALFKWFIASFLFGKRIQQNIAVQTYRVIIKQHQRDTPRKLGNCSHRELVRMLGEGGYARYDESTATRLLKLCTKLNDEYQGKVSVIQQLSDNRADLEKRLNAFEGVGPKTVEIFMREAGPVWY
ncbi:DNA methylase [Pseudomonas sp. NyZ704]|nr:DNA methylase [Pseudomonas sp. NyZ704]